MSTEPVEATTIIGVVHPFGIGEQGIGEKEWKLRFSFETWRDADGILHLNELVLSRRVGSRDELELYFERIHEYDILVARVVFTAPNAADLLEILDNDAQDEALAQRAAELSKPITIEHGYFGTLTFDRTIDVYIGTASWMGNQIELMLSTGDSALEQTSQVARELWINQAEWDNRVQEYVVEHMLKLKNSMWLDEDEDDVTPDEFKSRIRLKTIVVYPVGHFEFCYDDDYMFSKHTIHVSASLRDGLTDVDI